MAKLTSNGVTIEGTPEELAVIMKRFSVEAPVVEVEETPALKAGDYITITFGHSGSYYREITLGKEYEVVSEDGSLAFVDDTDDFRLLHIRRGLYTIVDKPDVFTANGRKVNEYREGDIIRYEGYKSGVYEVSHVANGNVRFFCEKFGKKTEYMPLESIRIITFVENRLDR